ncbi:hypothetical protein Htur_1982 [Haloterrigena turkmenica DSM 5511]|uniref:ArsR family transcriptional regulator n=1 Tax=Haloterrigena turkmenica (strain ATCC 51198 / DSM 5511 / JCM 9101 / NCIMB 13204 / VKM B-1734 / 4k) TaxID=543526 RepID=D2RSY6_HALTV|nr:hypothetical protein [Haloterrigena turkmenica]ADB60866.1 hypothetical protein Htur_1982 [Haloterrigena turkmenica DSM 5511]
MTDRMFDALADGYRRELLVDLLDHAPRRVSQPAGTSWEITESNDGLLRRHLSSSRAIPDADEALLRAHHIHLPKLDDYGYVEWDRDEHRVTRGPRFDEIRPIVELLDGRRDELPAECLRDPEEAPRVVGRSSK